MQLRTRAAGWKTAPVLFLALIITGLSAVPAPAQDVDITKIFWCPNEGADGLSPEEQVQLEQCISGRIAILYNCTYCHTFVPIVTQKTEAEWDATLRVHDVRIADLDPTDRELIRNYLVTMFNPNMPLPELPPELQGIGTDQAF